MSTGGFAYEPKPQPPMQWDVQLGGGSGSGSGSGGRTTSRGDAFDAGVRAGLERAQRHSLLEHAHAPFGIDDAEEVITQPLDAAVRVLARAKAPPRFVELFAEMVTVASVSRAAFHDQELDEQAIDSYAHRSFSFFNSWRHA
ncbi:MAG TPA: hypothetical protein VHF51_15000 [Solirubrobacteraceae bacterium]|nr:hypothetical protein [Solirubrobacteraceae bacterium]